MFWYWNDMKEGHKYVASIAAIAAAAGGGGFSIGW